MATAKKQVTKKAPVTKANTSKASAPSPAKPSLFDDVSQTETSAPIAPIAAARRIIKKGICPSRSEKSTLSYAIACDTNKEIHFQVVSNTGGGFFSQEWIAFTNIEKALASGPDINRITSYCLHKLFKGKSVNTPAFLLAVLVAENLLKPLPRCKRVHELCDTEEFLNRMNKLMATKINLPDDTENDPKLSGKPKPVKANLTQPKPLPKNRKPK